MNPKLIGLLFLALQWLPQLVALGLKAVELEIFMHVFHGVLTAICVTFSMWAAMVHVLELDPMASLRWRILEEMLFWGCAGCSTYRLATHSGPHGWQSAFFTLLALFTARMLSTFVAHRAAAISENLRKRIVRRHSGNHRRPKSDDRSGAGGP